MIELTAATLSINGADLSGFAQKVGVEIDPWQAELLEQAYAQDRPRGIENGSVQLTFRAWQNGLRSAFHDLLGLAPGQVSQPRMSLRRPWSVDTWRARRASGLGPQRVEVNRDRVDIVFEVAVAWGPLS